MNRLKGTAGFFRAAAVAWISILWAGTSGCALHDYGVSLGLLNAPEVTAVTIKVAVPLEYAKQYTAFLGGVELATEDIAQLGSPVDISVEVDDDRGSFSSAIDLVQGYAADPAVIGVVGHWYSDICSSVTDLYNRSNKTLVVPTVSMTGLATEDTPYIFQNIPSDRQIGKALCDYAAAKGISSVVIYYEDSAYGFTMSAEVEKYCSSLGITVCDRISGLVRERDMVDAKRKWDAAGYEAVILISNVEEGAVFVNRLRALGSDAMVLCGDGMDSESLPKLLAGDAGELYVASINNSETAKEGLIDFRERYEKKYGTQPDVWAFQGYDSVMLIAHAVAEHGVTTSEGLRDYLESAREIDSIFGTLRFNLSHEVEGKSIYLMKVSRSGMEFVWGENENGAK